MVVHLSASAINNNNYQTCHVCIIVKTTLPDVGVIGAPGRPLMVAMCCIWAAAKAAIGLRYPPWPTDAINAACCCTCGGREAVHQNRDDRFAKKLFN